MFWFWCIWGHSGLYSMKKPPKKSLGEKSCVSQTVPWGCRLWVPREAVRPWLWGLSPRGDFEEDSCSQTSDQAILHKRNISLMLVQWHLELVAVFLHHTVLFKDVIYQRKRQGCSDNLSLSWFLVLYWKKALLTGKPVSTRRNLSQCPSSPLPVR